MKTPELFAYVPIEDVKLEELEIDKDYLCKSKLFDSIVTRSGGHIRLYYKNIIKILLPYTPPQQKVSDDIDFSEWVASKRWIYCGNSSWQSIKNKDKSILNPYGKDEIVNKTTQELYELFKNK